MSKKVLIIQHSVGVQPGFTTEFLQENNIPYEILHIYDSEQQIKLPDNQTQDYLAIVSLGGPQAAYEDDIYPYLKWEKKFLAAQLALNTPILGLCLGAQLIADIAGGEGHLGRNGPEAGYVKYELTPQGKTDPVLAKVFEQQGNQPLLIMHHEDSFDLPSNVPALAYTSNGYVAAFRVGSAFAVQFHPEASLQDFNGFVERTRYKHPEYYANTDIDAVLCEVRDCEDRAKISRRLFFDTWWNSLCLK